ncbi:choline/ethanolamine transporter flvcr2a isoform X1 [Parasteatoda tepidariorum]|uniref:choline/ethanolamine transporter flvcr2a isoform X1 n=1 Tax=Parasteatoda tepidariorum TaxID=114398 RepID=UPI001C725844|nr:feline leukemia virus subgroup C receptor-related protein 2 isoform X1 [Parasteatoda tepidariorum]XP_042896552.1 feline leukemia virus subgroup C receptor-related protein 2 isoform X1 [Parasteatoda tepidariorum]
MSSHKSISELVCSKTEPSTHLNVNLEKESAVKVYRKRYWILFLFSSLSLLCGMLFPQYVSNANVNMCYYNISMNMLNWTAYMLMVVYVVFVFPVSYLMNYIGLRWTIIAVSVTNTIACALQFTGLKPDGFSFILLSTAFTSASNILVLAVPPFLAATWFPSNELSRACSAGVFGNQLGIALGYLFSPLMVSNDCEDKPLIENGKFKVATILTILNLIWLMLVLFTFQNAPKSPPTQTQIKKEPSESHTKSVITMFKNLNFVLLFIMYGLTVGTYFAITTILNNLILRYFPHREVEIGWMGTLFIISGLVGSMIAGTILDYTHRFKETTLGICIASMLTFILFCTLLVIKSLWVTFLTIGIFGFFLTSFLPVGLEYGIELTFPEPEIISASLLNASSNLFGLILTEIASRLLDAWGQRSSNIAIAVFLFMSSLITIFISSEYKRNKRPIKDSLKHEQEKTYH